MMSQTWSGKPQSAPNRMQARTSFLTGGSVYRVMPKHKPASAVTASERAGFLFSRNDMSYPWFRCYSEMAHDEKILFVSRELGMSKLEISGAWSLVLCLASDSPVRGKLLVTLQKRYSNISIAEVFKESVEITDKILKAFIEMEMLALEKGTYIVVNWGKRQPNSDNSAERVRKFREKQEGEKRYKTVTETLPSVSTSSSDSNIFKKYTDEIGPLTQRIGDALKEAEIEYPEPGWIQAAIDEASRQNKRSWAYCEAILKRWKAEGFQSNHKKNGNEQELNPADYASEVY
jgi:DnaD/phage-associated family protein